MPTMNQYKHIPIDILALIFEEYAPAETEEHPIETLMLVCKAWNETSLRVQSIWSNYHINIVTGPDATRWAALIRRRLPRSGQSAPISISIYVSLEVTHGVPELYKRSYTPFKRRALPQNWFPDPILICPAYNVTLEDPAALLCPCKTEILSCLNSIMRLLVGKEGQYCARWTSLNSHPGHVQFTDENFKYLRYPTPNIQSLHISTASTRLDEDSTFLPSTPRLQELSIDRSYIPVANIGPFISTLSRLQRLTLGDSNKCFGYQQTYVIPNVTDLFLAGNAYDIHVMTPRLQSLTLEISPENLESVLSQNHISFEQVLHLGVFYGHYFADKFLSRLRLDQNTVNATARLLERTKAVKSIRGDRPSVFIFLKALKQVQLAHSETQRLRITVASINDYKNYEEIYEMHYEIDTGLDMVTDIELIEAQPEWKELTRFFTIA